MNKSAKPLKTARTGDGKFAKGSCANPNGRPPKPEIQQLRDALAVVETAQGKTFLQHYVERAFKDNNVANCLAKKILPDLSEVKSDELHRVIVEMGRVLINGREAKYNVGD